MYGAAQVVQPLYPMPAHCAQCAAVQPPVVLEVAGAALLVVVEDEVALLVVVEDDVEDEVALVVVEVTKVDDVDDVEILVVLVDVLVVLLTEVLVEPPPLLETWKLPVNLRSRELAPTLTPNVPAGTTHCWPATSQ